LRRYTRRLSADGSAAASVGGPASRPARDTGNLSRVSGTIVAMCRADQADQAMDMSTFGNPGWLAVVVG